MSNQRVELILDALGDPTRRRIVECLQRGELPVGELSHRLPVGRPAVSKHLAVLERVGVVRHRSVGTRNLYGLAPGALDELRAWLDGMWSSALAGFGSYAAEQDEGRP